MNDLMKNRGFQIGAAVAAVVALGGVYIYTMNPFGSSEVDTGSTAPVVGAPDEIGGPGDLPPRESLRPRPITPPRVAQTAPQTPKTSWDDDPSGPSGGGAPTPGEFGQGSTPVGPAKPKPAPIRVGAVAPGARPDPFVTFLRTVSLNPPAYSLIVPGRLASFPKFELNENEDSVRQIGPLPAVSRRVAGIVTSNGVTAILESGDPGANVDVQVVQPGAQIESLIPGIEKLTVESITSTGLTLREAPPYRRKVEVKLSPLPPGFDRNQLGGGAGGPGSGPQGAGPTGFGPAGSGGGRRGGGGVAGEPDF